MNQIEKLVEELCPNGVTHLPLEDFLTIRNGKDHKHLEDGEIPVYGSGGIMRHVNQAAASGPSVLIPRKGSLGNLFYVEGPFWVVDTIFRTEINEDIALPKFVFYELQTLGLGEMNQAGGVPSQTQSKLKKLRIPIPPLPIQQEIVKILDTFQSLEAELEAELEARKKQYEFYRNQLLTFTERERVQRTTLGDIFGMKAGKAIRRDEISPVRTASHPFPAFGGNGVRGYVREASHPERAVLIGRQGALCGNVNWAPEDFYATEHAIVMNAHDSVNIRWAYHMLKFLDLNQYATKSAQPGLSVQRLKSVPIPIPPLEEQERIVNILDKFDALVNNLTSGLPAEIEARRQQYEYYRNQLLTFKELAA